MGELPGAVQDINSSEPGRIRRPKLSIATLPRLPMRKDERPERGLKQLFRNSGPMIYRASAPRPTGTLRARSLREFGASLTVLAARHARYLRRVHESADADYVVGPRPLRRRAGGADSEIELVVDAAQLPDGDA